MVSFLHLSVLGFADKFIPGMFAKNVFTRFGIGEISEKEALGILKVWHFSVFGTFYLDSTFFAHCILLFSWGLCSCGIISKFAASCFVNWPFVLLLKHFVLYIVFNIRFLVHLYCKQFFLHSFETAQMLVI